MIPWKLIGGALAAIALVVGVYFAGHRAGADATARKWQATLDRQAKAQARIDRAAAAIDLEAARRDGVRQAEVREIYRDAIRVVERPVYRNAWADAAGVGLLERAVAAANDEPGTAVGRTAGGTAAVQAAAGDGRPRQR